MQRESLRSVQREPEQREGRCVHAWCVHWSLTSTVDFIMYFRMYSEARRWGSGWERVGEKKKNSSSSWEGGVDEGKVSSCGCCSKATIGT